MKPALKRFVWFPGDVVIDQPKGETRRSLGGVGSGIVGHTTDHPSSELTPKGNPDERADWEGSLLGDEREAVEAYPGPEGRSEAVNARLRKTKGAWTGDSSSDNHFIKDLDSALAKSTNTTVQDLYRGIASASFSERMTPGFTWMDKGYVSTSLDPDYAKVFGGRSFVPSKQERGGGPMEPYKTVATVLHIQTKKGAYIQDVVGTTTLGDEEINEHEWLLPRGLKYQVTHVDEKPSDSRHSTRLISVKVLDS